MKKVLISMSIILASLVAVLGGYVGYLFIQYRRIPDAVALGVQENKEGTLEEQMKVGKEYAIATYNLGFGAYTPDFDFFMDEGKMKDGTVVKGKHGTAIDKEHVEKAIDGALSFVKEKNYDFYLFQEVDTNSTRSYHVNEYEKATSTLPNYESVFASNFHSAYLLYPFHDPHGKVNSGIATFSSIQVQDATRYSFTVSKGIDKFFDLDRCFSVSFIDLDNGKQLALINLHMSAYDKGGVIRAQQMLELGRFMERMKNDGHYVIAGGDFNHDLLTYNPKYSYTKENFPFQDQTEQVKPDWLAYFFNEDSTSHLPEGFQIVASDNTSTCRAAEMTWQKGINYVTVVDGFIVSDNVQVIAQENLENDYAYSDHQPATMRFKLL